MVHSKSARPTTKEMLALLYLLPLVQGTIVSLSIDNSLLPPFELDFADPLTGKFTKIANLSAGSICGALRNDNTFVYPAAFPTQESCLITVDLSTGKVHEGQRYSTYLFYNIAFDKLTNQTFVTSCSATNSLLELLPDQTLRKIADFPEPFYVGASAYSSSKHMFFLFTGSEEPAVSKLLAVGTVGAQEGKTLYNVSVVALGQNNIVFDDTLGVLYAWGYKGTQAKLVSLDFTTGKILKTFFESSTLLAFASCVNKDGSVLYSSVLNQQSTSSMLLTVELGTNKTTLVPAERFALTMSFE